MAQNDSIRRLARQMEAQARKDEYLHLTAAEVISVRREGSRRLHQVCAEFVDSVNRLLSQALLELAPLEYSPELFRQPGANLFQISSQGRILQISFEATSDTYSTDKFLIPYTLDGELRTYNQDMLEHLSVQTVSLFYCLEPEGQVWRHFDWRTNRTGIVDREFLAVAMERLL